LHTPLAQLVPVVHGWPDASLQLPVPSHACVPLHPLPVVPSAGNTHAPVVTRHPVAPHGVVVGLHAVAQQKPEPLTPHVLFVHWSFALQAAPVPPLATHEPAVGPVRTQYCVEGSAQSPSPLHDVRHADPPDAQARLFAHAPGDPAVHPPAPSHALSVSVLPVHDDPHDVPPPG
jgi:hypothetical protein